MSRSQVDEQQAQAEQQVPKRQALPLGCHTPKDMSKLYEVSDQAIYYWIDSGDVLATKYGGRYAIPDIEFWRFHRIMGGLSTGYLPVKLYKKMYGRKR